jgi:Na+-driven multidrug efflux pump
MGMVLMNGLMGAGDTRRSMWITVTAQWAFFLPLAYVVGPVLGFGLLGIWILNGIYRAGQALVCAQQWHSRKWTGIDI